MTHEFSGTYIGYVFDQVDDGEKPPPALLTIEGDSIVLEIPAIDDRFMSTVDKTTPDPERLVFINEKQCFDLSGLRNTHRSSSLNGYSTDVYEADTAVRAGRADADYRQIDGLKTRLTGLADWIAPDTFSYEIEVNEQSRPQSVTYKVEQKAPIPVGGVAGLSLRPSFSYDFDWPNRRHSLTETMLIETMTPAPSDWGDHLKHHRALQDLLTLSYWWPCDADVDTVLRNNDPETSIDGTPHPHPETWRQAQVVGFGRRYKGEDVRPLPSRKRALFTYNDIGASGLEKWYSEYEPLGPAFWVLASACFRSGGVVETRLLQVGVALEALGYELALRSGRMTAGRRDPSFTFVEAVRTVATATDCSLDSVTGTFPDLDGWLLAFNTAYKGVKHADNPLPRGQESYDRAAEGALLARLWLARHLGVNRTELESRKHRFHSG